MILLKSGNKTRLMLRVSPDDQMDTWLGHGDGFDSSKRIWRSTIMHTRQSIIEEMADIVK